MRTKLLEFVLQCGFESSSGKNRNKYNSNTVGLNVQMFVLKYLIQPSILRIHAPSFDSVYVFNLYCCQKYITPKSAACNSVCIFLTGNR